MGAHLLPFFTNQCKYHSSTEWFMNRMADFKSLLDNIMLDHDWQYFTFVGAVDLAPIPSLANITVNFSSNPGPPIPKLQQPFSITHLRNRARRSLICSFFDVNICFIFLYWVVSLNFLVRSWTIRQINITSE